MKVPRMNFNTGEISPVLWWRSDLNKYGSSCKKLENYLNLPQGGVRRRFGSEVIARISDVNSDVRIIVWQVSKSEHYNLIFTGTDILVYDEEGSLVFTINSIPWAAADFQQLYVKQIFDVMYVAHPDYPVKQIRRTSPLVWDIIDHPLLPSPIADQNVDTTETMTMVLDAGPDQMTVTSSSPQFKASDVGRMIRIRGEGAGSDADNYNSASAGTTSTPLAAKGTVKLRTEGGIWDGKLVLQESRDGGTTWDDIGSITSKDGKHNGEIERDIDLFGAYVRVDMRERSAAPSDTGCIWTLEVADVQYNYVTIDTFVSDTEVDGTLIGGLTDTITTYNWAFGAFGDDEGYPACVEIYEERLMLGGVESSPATVYGSKINNWENFEEGTLATSAIQFTLSADVRNRIRWMVTEQELILGTDYSEWTIGTRETRQPLTGENVTAQRQTQFGTEPIQPIVSSDMTLYVEAGGRRLRSTQYAYEKDGYASIDMSILAPHLTEDFEIVRMAFSRSPDQIIWAVREDGTLMAFTYERENNVSAWSRHPFSDGGQVIDINSILTESGDVVNLLVNRSDGLYFEVIRQQNLCFDWSRHYENMTVDQVVTLIGNEDFSFYSEDLTKDAEHFEGKETGIYIHILSAITDLVIKYDGVQLDLTEDIVSLGDDLYWYDLGDDKSKVTVFDFTTPQVEDTDFKLDLHTETYVVHITNSIYTPSALTIKKDAVDLVEDTDYWNMPSPNQVLIIDMDGVTPGQITVFAGPTQLTDADYQLIVPRAQVALPQNSTETSFYTAIQMQSLLRTTDIMNFPDQGGGGTRNKVHEVDAFVVDSVGGEVSANQETDFREIRQIPKDLIAGERIPSYTGKLEVRMQHGYQDEMDITFKNDTPYNQILASIGSKVERYSD